MALQVDFWHCYMHCMFVTLLHYKTFPYFYFKRRFRCFCVQYLCVFWQYMGGRACRRSMHRGFALQGYIMMWFTFYLFKFILHKQAHALRIPLLSRNSHEWIQAAQVWIRLQYIASADYSLYAVATLVVWDLSSSLLFQIEQMLKKHSKSFVNS